VEVCSQASSSGSILAYFQGGMSNLPPALLSYKCPLSACLPLPLFLRPYTLPPACGAAKGRPEMNPTLSPSTLHLEQLWQGRHIWRTTPLRLQGTPWCLAAQPPAPASALCGSPELAPLVNSLCAKLAKVGFCCWHLKR
jgi:hypothetical protein